MGSAFTSRPSLRVLLVDDDEQLAWAFRAFEDERVELRQVGSMKEAIRLLARAGDDLDVLIIDESLPDGDCVELLHAARRLAPDAQTIVVSDFPCAEMNTRTRLLGAFAYVEKPVAIARAQRFRRTGA